MSILPQSTILENLAEEGFVFEEKISRDRSPDRIELEFRLLSRSKSAIAVRLANSSQEQQWSLATSYQT